MAHRLESARCARIAQEMGLDIVDVRKVILSFFGEIRRTAALLPFDDERRIYGKDMFDEYEVVFNIPYIGRIGTVYSRYLKWRENEAKASEQELKSKYRQAISSEEYDDMARTALAGGNVILPKRQRSSELYNRIWLVRKDGKKMARQVIPKTKK